MPEPKYKFLNPAFLEAMDEIGQYGHEKYGEFSFHARAARGDHSRGEHARTSPVAIAEHSKSHFAMYLRGEIHDHFGTFKHQLAAAAFNAMMEFYFEGLEGEQRRATSLP